MIENTFLIARGVGAKKEKALWENGVLTWDDFLSCGSIDCISDSSKKKCEPYLEEARMLLRDRDCKALGCMLEERNKKGEQWRLFGEFSNDAAYIDIETDGLDRDSLVTVVTVHRKDRTYTLVHGDNLDAESLEDALDGAKMFVSFNGTCFDIPVLRNSFPNVDLDLPHFDLRFGCRHVGMTGGLKNIEKQMGIFRSEDIDGVDGEEAVHLWHAWERRGDREALDRLVKYNRADTINLEGIADVVYGRLVNEYAGFGNYL